MEASEVRDLFNYNPETGVLTWRVTVSAHKAGSVAGTKTTRGYICVRYDGKYYLAHRLAVAWMTGQWPKAQTDHVDRDTTNNKWRNLREATASENAANRKVAATNKLGLKGVIRRNGAQFRHAPFEAYLRKDGVKYYLGRFLTAEEAHKAYIDAAAEHHGQYSRPRSGANL